MLETVLAVYEDYFVILFCVFLLCNKEMKFKFLSNITQLLYFSYLISKFSYFLENLQFHFLMLNMIVNITCVCGKCLKFYEQIFFLSCNYKALRQLEQAFCSSRVNMFWLQIFLFIERGKISGIFPGVLNSLLQR